MTELTLLGYDAKLTLTVEGQEIDASDALEVHPFPPYMRIDPTKLLAAVSKSKQRRHCCCQWPSRYCR